MIRHRQRAQIIPLAMVGMIAMIGAVALVVDAGVFFVTERQLQAAVDSAALAAVWYSPVCNTIDSTFAFGCQSSAAPLVESCAGRPADCVANAVFQQNLAYAGALCESPQTSSGTTTDVKDPQLVDYTMTVTCNAPYWFARIFPNMPTMQITTTAVATSGFPTTDKTTVTHAQINPTELLVSRLLN